jgi:hypothetical protein
MTSPPKHTAGPWHIERGEIWSDEELLGVVYRTEAWNSGEKVETEDQANACLIAAAPKLLKALQAMVDAWADPLAFGTSTDIHENARAAIAIATAEMFPRSRATIRAALESVRAELDGENGDGTLKAPKPRRAVGMATKRKAPKRR